MKSGMAPTFIDLKNPANVVKEVFDSDESIKKKFSDAFSAQTLAFAEAFAPAYVGFESLLNAGNSVLQTELVAAFMHGVLDDLLISTKLLLTGKLSASGNLVRQATEGLCMTIMCSHVGTLEIGKKEQVYWQLVQADDEAVNGNLAPRQLVHNWERLGLLSDGATQLKETVDTHHAHSHAGRLAMANRMDLGANGYLHFGGHFDPEKSPAYDLELQQRTGLCKLALIVCQQLLPKVQAVVKNST